ncbi:MAG: nusA [Anaerolineales bacterium]|jgi:N utilization substance protein A|nr:nusA [Anaerolineales bacterium]
MKSELTLAFNEIAEHSKLKREIILEALESAMVTAYRKSVNASAAQHVVAKIDPLTGGIRVFAEKEVVEKVLEPHTEVTLEDARQVDSEANLGDMVTVDSTPKDFGRIAAQAAKQVILQRLREAERESQYQEYVQREGDIVNGTVQAVSSQSITIGLGRTEATLPRNQTMPGERYHAHQKVRAFVLEVRKTTRGPQIIVSRTHKNMLRRLLEYEVPEIYNGSVEIKSIAREPGRRSKVAVAALQDGVDPVGACVGMRGVRIQSIVKELSDEKIDVIEWNPDQATFIAKALSPARVTAVYLDDDPISGRTAMVVVPDDQLSLAIGREGQNARLAAKLTSWRIDIKSLSEAANEAVQKLREDASFDTTGAPPEIFKTAEVILAKKAEGKPIAPEDYQLLGKVVELQAKRMARGRQEERAAKVEKVAAIKATIPAAARAMPLAQAPLPEHLLRLLAEADFQNVGEVMEQLALDEKRISHLEGFGSKEVETLKKALAEMTFPEPQPEPAPEPVAPSPEPAAEVSATVEAAALEAAPVAEAVSPAAEAPAAGTVEGEEELEEAEDLEDKDEEEVDEAGKKKAKKKGKKKGAVEITFDEEKGVYVTRKKRKAGRSKDDPLLNLGDE